MHSKMFVSCMTIIIVGLFWNQRVIFCGRQLQPYTDHKLPPPPPPPLLAIPNNTLIPSDLGTNIIDQFNKTLKTNPTRKKATKSTCPSGNGKEEGKIRKSAKSKKTASPSAAGEIKNATSSATGGSRRKKLQEFDPFQQQPGQGVPGVVPGGGGGGVPGALGPYNKNRTKKEGRCNKTIVLLAFFIYLLAWTIKLPVLPTDGSCQIRYGGYVEPLRMECQPLALGGYECKARKQYFYVQKDNPGIDLYCHMEGDPAPLEHIGTGSATNCVQANDQTFCTATFDFLHQQGQQPQNQQPTPDFPPNPENPPNNNPPYIPPNNPVNPPYDPPSPPQIPPYNNPVDPPPENPPNPPQIPVDPPPDNPPPKDPPPYNPGPSGCEFKDWPQEQGVATLHETKPVPVFFDGGFVRYSAGGELGNGGASEHQSPLFLLYPGAKLQNVIIGPDGADGIHCQGPCTLENVWWDNVGEDAATFLSPDPGAVYNVNYGGARGAHDKVFQHDGAGTVRINNFVVEHFGKLYRSCGNCPTQYPRHVQLNCIRASSGFEIVGINQNYGDTASLSNFQVDNVSGGLCATYEGNKEGKNPKPIHEYHEGEPPGGGCKY